MKILFICTGYPISNGDKEDKRLLNIMKQLNKQGHELYLSGFFNKPSSDRTELFKIASMVPPAPGVEDFMQPVQQFFKEKLLQDTAKIKPDLIFAYGIAAARYLPFESQIPCMADLRRCEYIAMQKENEQGGFLKKLAGTVTWNKAASIETNIASRCAVVFMPKERDKYYLSKQTNLDITVMPDAIDTEIYDISEWIPDPSRLLFTGSVTEEGNFMAVKYYKDHLAAAFGKDGVTLYVTGKYTDAHAKSLFGKNIQPMGFMKDIREAYQTAQAVIIPIVGGIGAVGKITEAMACGVPVISTKAGAEGLHLTPKDECILIANTAEEMTAARRRLLDRAFADKIRNNARRFVEENYSWTVNGSLLKEEIKRAVTKK